MSELVFTYRILRSEPGCSFRYTVEIFVKGWKAHTSYANTKWGAHRLARRFKSQWLARRDQELVEEGTL